MEYEYGAINMENDMENTGQSTPQLTTKERTKKIRYLGTIRLLSDLEKIEIIFLVVAFLSITSACVITLIRVSESSPGQPDYTFGILLIINLVFVSFYTVHGVFCEKPFELLVSVAATLIVLLYCIIEYATQGYKNEGSRKDMKLARLITVCLFGPVDMVLGLIITYQFFVSKRLIFRTVGGNVGLQNMCQIMFSFTAFVKFDFQLVLSLLVLVLNGAGDEVLSVLQKLALGVGVPVSFLWMFLGFMLIRFEKWKLSASFWFVGLLFPAAIIFQFTRLKKRANNPFLFPATITACCLGLIIRIVTLVLSYFVTRNFNKGLKDKVYPVDADKGKAGSRTKN